MSVPLTVFLAGIVALVTIVGCGEAETGPATMPGERVARMAEEQLEADHPGMAPGILSCPDLAFEIGATTRCTRIAELSRGRRVRVLGTVEVTSVAGGGALHVRLDDAAKEFGLDGGFLASRLGDRLDKLGRTAPDSIDCPYLVGRIGASVVCTVSFPAGSTRARIRVTSVDPSSYEVGYSIDPEDPVL
jgi:hypothetical protein